MAKENTPAAPASTEYIELEEAAFIEVEHAGRKYEARMHAGRWQVVDVLGLEVDPYANKIRKTTLDRIRPSLKIKG